MRHSLFLTFSEEDVEAAENLCELLNRIDIKCELRKKGDALWVEWNTKNVNKKLSRGAGAKTKELKRFITVDEVRERMKSESAEDIAISLGISRATLFRKLKYAEEWDNRYL